MPIYEYHCSSCAQDFEILQKMSESPLNNCPSCGANTMQRLVSAAGFELKGTGWYATDFKNKPKPAVGEKKASEVPKPESTATTSSNETKKGE